MLKFNKNIKIGDRMIGPDYPTYFIAEIGGNFDGSLEKAKRLVDAAKEAGADCAKFQTFKAESIVSEGGFSKMTLHGVHGSWGRTVSEVFKDVEFPMEWHREIADYCKKVGIKRLTEQKRNMLIPRLRALYDPEIDGEDITYWQDGTDRNITTYRVSDDSELNRPIDCIPKIELINALEDTVRASGSLMRENAISAVARALGFTRTGAKINETIGKVLEAEIASGRIRESNGRLTLSE